MTYYRTPPAFQFIPLDPLMRIKDAFMGEWVKTDSREDTYQDTMDSRLILPEIQIPGQCRSPFVRYLLSLPIIASCSLKDDFPSSSISPQYDNAVIALPGHKVLYGGFHAGRIALYASMISHCWRFNELERLCRDILLNGSGY